MTAATRSEAREPAARDRYWRIQRALARRQIIPFLTSAGMPPRGRKLVDIGCGEGGVAAELARAGALAHGLDLSEERIDLGRSLARAARIDVDLRVGDGCDPAAAPGPFDLVILRDILEHVREPARFLRHARRILAPGGRLLVSFPPFFSPFGLHQQLLVGQPIRWIPWLSLLPPRLLERIIAPGRFEEDIRELNRCRLTITAFEAAAARERFRPLARRGYLVRPSHAIRYGAPIVPATPLLAAPFLREVLLSGVIFLLGKEEKVGGD